MNRVSYSILTVDDSETVRKVIRRVFNQYDCVVREATNGEEGLFAVSQERPDVILLDLTMPIMDGTTMLEKLRADSTSRDIPVIMLTAEHGQENVIRIISLGVQDYLVKPFKGEQLREKVQKVIPLRPKETTSATAAASSDAAPVGVASAAEFGNAAIPQSIKELGKLIALRDATLGDYAKIIVQDTALTERLLRTTNARAAGTDANPATTVEDALQRVGITSMLLLAVSDPLIRAVVQNVHAKLGIDLAVLRPDDTKMPLLAPDHLVGAVDFVGKVTGNIKVRFPTSSTSLLRERLRDSATESPADAAPGSLASPFYQEVFGTFVANLWEAGLGCRLGTVDATMTADASLSTHDGYVANRYTFWANELFFCADLSVNSHIDYASNIE